MKTYTTSRGSSGNHVFPSTITLDDAGLHIKDPSLFSGLESTTPYSKISSVKTNCPIIGFSDVIIDIMGADQLKIHGFNATDAKAIKAEILERIQ